MNTFETRCYICLEPYNFLSKFFPMFALFRTNIPLILAQRIRIIKNVQMW